MTNVVPEQLQVGPWYATAKFWKRCSVFLSIALSAASLIVSAIASLSTQHESNLNALKVAGVVVSTISIMLSALTSLDWRRQATHDKQFATQLLKITHTHEGDNIVITSKASFSDLPPSS